MKMSLRVKRTFSTNAPNYEGEQAFNNSSESPSMLKIKVGEDFNYFRNTIKTLVSLNLNQLAFS